MVSKRATDIPSNAFSTMIGIVLRGEEIERKVSRTCSGGHWIVSFAVRNLEQRQCGVSFAAKERSVVVMQRGIWNAFVLNRL